MQEGFQRQSENVTSNWRGAKSTEKTYSHFGLHRGRDGPLRIKLLWRNGESFSFSYALLPTVAFYPDVGLVLIFSNYKVSIAGRGLQVLENYLSEERVVWIKESPSAIDDENEDVFVEHIEIISLED